MWRRRLPHSAKWVLGTSCDGRTDRQMRAFTDVPSQPSPSFQGICQDVMHPGRPMLGGVWAAPSCLRPPWEGPGPGADASV